ncbi:MAG TPA: DciA family protein [Allosphingosinicella sp.]
MLEAMAKSGSTTEKRKPAKGADEPQRSRRARSVSDMLPDVGRAAFRRFGFVQSSVVSRWREIVGERYAGVSTPESIRFPHGRRSDGVLTLVVEGAHAPMMQHVAPVIMERVNRFFGYPAVERLAFKQGIVKVAKAKARTAPPSLRPLPAELGDSLRVIADPELRACLESLARGVAASEGEPIATEVTTIPVVGKLTR